MLEESCCQKPWMPWDWSCAEINQGLSFMISVSIFQNLAEMHLSTSPVAVTQPVDFKSGIAQHKKQSHLLVC